MWIRLTYAESRFKSLGHDKRGLPITPTVALNTQKIAHKAPIIDNRRKPLLLIRFFATVTFLLVTDVPLNLMRLKLDIRTKVWLRGPSQAEAGVDGIDSNNSHRADENWLLVPPPFCPSLYWGFTLIVGFIDSGITPK
jgi:hypothetical protein